MKFWILAVGLIIAGPAAAEISEHFDSDRAIDRYWNETDACRRAAMKGPPSCNARKIYHDALDENGYCGVGIGVNMNWKKCGMPKAN